ncbi:MAG: low temperature requirement protein A [Corynebacteriales bacterium]|nr:low temperature requirement protein A [Mycobacteriales bacterium]
MKTENLLRGQGSGAAKVTFVELFFDLVYVFAVTQLSHLLVAHPNVHGAFQTLLLMLAVWWAWMYTTWTTNWFDPDHKTVRFALIGVMLGSLLMSAALPQAFGDTGKLFAFAYVGIQVGRTLFMVIATWRHEFGPSFQRILVWLTFSGMFWIAGAFASDGYREILWLIGLTIDYAGPWCRYFTPGLGRSETSDWKISGEHMAERCQLFIIIALGESLLVTGSLFGDLEITGTTFAAFFVAFAGSVAMWWIYFDRSAEHGSEVIANAQDPGRLGRSAYTYAHIPMVAGIIVAAVADEKILAHPSGHTSMTVAFFVLGGPAMFVLGHALYKNAHGARPSTHALAFAALALLFPLHAVVTPLVLGATATAVLLGLATWESLAWRRSAHENVHHTEANLSK